MRIPHRRIRNQQAFLRPHNHKIYQAHAYLNTVGPLASLISDRISDESRASPS